MLGSILLSEQALDPLLIDVRLRPDDFYRERHRLIFRAMLRLKEKADPEPVDVLTVCEQLTRSRRARGGRRHGVRPLAAELRPGGRQRPPLRAHRQGARAHAAPADDDARDPGPGLRLRRRGRASCSSRPRAASSRSRHEDRTGELRSIEDVLHEELDKLEKVSREGISLTGTPSGFKDIDEVTGGFQPGNLIVLAARPSMGKSALVTNIAENAAIDHDKPVALFSLEMSETELAQRFIASQASLNGDDLRKGRVKADRWPKVSRPPRSWRPAPLYVDDSSDIGDARAARQGAAAARSRRELGLIDRRLPPAAAPGGLEPTAASSRSARSAVASRSSPASSKIPVIAVSQLSRAVESRPDKKPLLSDLRESGPGRAGRRPRHVHLPRGVLRQGELRARRARRTSSSPSTATAR